jgi:hypothetical protein
MPNGDLKIYREYSQLHTGKVYSITSSDNCNYLFTTGED